MGTEEVIITVQFSTLWVRLSTARWCWGEVENLTCTKWWNRRYWLKFHVRKDYLSRYLKAYRWNRLYQQFAMWVLSEWSMQSWHYSVSVGWPAENMETYKRLNPRTIESPIFNFGAIWSFHTSIAGITVKMISVTVLVAPWKYPKSACTEGLQQTPGVPIGSHNVANFGHWTTIRMIVRMLITACWAISP